MNYVVIKTGGKQYKTGLGKEILVDKLNTLKGEKCTFPEVLLFRTDDEIVVGNPYVADVRVTGRVVDVIKGEKITISKFKAKVHYRRKMGFRPMYSKVRIESISIGGKAMKSEEKVSASKMKKAKTSVSVKKLLIPPGGIDTREIIK